MTSPAFERQQMDCSLSRVSFDADQPHDLTTGGTGNVRNLVFAKRIGKAAKVTDKAARCIAPSLGVGNELIVLQRKLAW